MYNCIFIVGATATGKTALSVELAKKLHTEIINADSTQVYKELSVGTAKATPEEMQGVTHHLMSFLNPNQEFSVSEFQQSALNIMNDLWAKGKLPIVVGGTGFYVESLLNHYRFGDTIKNTAIREKLEQQLETEGKDVLYEQLKQIDPNTAQKLHPNDTKRVMRALEIYLASGKTKTQAEQEKPLQSSTIQTPVSPLIIGLTMDRDKLYERINGRSERMIQDGLLTEVTQLKDKGYSPEQNNALKSIGYKELFAYLTGQCSLSEAIEKIKQNTRNYAKRQITWFKHMPGIQWVDLTKTPRTQVIDEILTQIQK